MQKIAILFLNFGGPQNLKEVTPFLFRLFRQREILYGIPLPMRIFLAALIALLKSKNSRQNYAKIGGGSPQLAYTWTQAEKSTGFLKEMLQVEVRAFVGMRSSKPSFQDAILEIKKFQPQKLVVLPLFPQNSLTTTKPYLEDIRKLLQRYKLLYEIYEISGWHDHPTYIKLKRCLLQEKLALLKEEEYSYSHVLFTAHSLPYHLIKKGDSYQKETEKTVSLIAESLPLSYSLAYQSRLKGQRWLSPYTDAEIMRLAREGIKNLIVMPVSFVSDHIETLYELDHQYRQLAHSYGIEKYLRCRTFNDDENFALFLAQLIQEKLVS
ncbi:MAG: ferrochelatase [Leptospiraceae bacterium]|nr:ferrochelatase [Leptospiraceae bacterium]MDW8305726.1 ferrochelatase [Leptospiraceae bacterium]